MKTTLRLPTCGLLPAILALGACATSSKPIGEWRDAEYTASLDKLLIVAATEQSSQRRLFEDEFVEGLVEAGLLPSKP